MRRQQLPQLLDGVVALPRPLQMPLGHHQLQARVGALPRPLQTPRGHHQVQARVGALPRSLQTPLRHHQAEARVGVRAPLLKQAQVVLQEQVRLPFQRRPDVVDRQGQA